MIIFPDIHGRDFWKEHKDQDDTFIFLGDYVDPYPRENISSKTVIENLEEIIEFQNSGKKVITLAGNHDLTYISPEHSRRCRFDHENQKVISDLLKKLDLYIFWTIEDHGKQWVFSHAGLNIGWYNTHCLGTPILQTTEIINNEFRKDNPAYLKILAEANWYWRGGDHSYGSPLWCDLREFHPATDKEYQIFGHTQLVKEPVITNEYACLDCRRAFKLEGGKICGL